MRGVCAVISLGLVACHPPARHSEHPGRSNGEPLADTATPPATRTAKVTGAVLDGTSRTPLLGATIVLESDAHGTEAAISDEDGQFALAVAPGTWRVKTHYVDAATTHPSIVAAADETLARDLLVPHAVVVAAELTPAERAACPLSDLAPSPADRDELIRAAVARYLEGTSTCAGRPPEGELVYIEAPAASRFRTSALPEIGRQLVVRTAHELEVEATRRDRRIPFVRVEVDELTATCAHVSIGAAVAQPARDRAWIHSCHDLDAWEKHGGRWQHRAHIESTCS